MKNYRITVKNKEQGTISEYDVKIQYLKNTKSIKKWLEHPIFSAIIAGFVSGMLLMATPFVYDTFTKRTDEQEKLYSLYLGVNSEYIGSKFGVPIINHIDSEKNMEYSYYKGEQTVVLCTYESEILIAYMIFQKEKENFIDIEKNFEYRNYFEPERTLFLTEFSLSDVPWEIISQSYGEPSNYDDYVYYAEIYKLNSGNDYNHVLLGSYKDRTVNDDFVDLIYGTKDGENVDNLATYRNNVYPNVFGVIKRGYENEIGIIPDIDELDILNNAIFFDW